MQVAITGSSGFIGSALVKAFASQGDEVLAIARSSGGVSVPGVRHLATPLNPSALGPALCSSKPEVLIHCVGAPTLYHAQNNAQSDFTDTVATTSDVLAALREFSSETLFVLISSASVYGDRGNILLSEDLTPEPISVYGYNKWMAELLVRQYASQFESKTLIVRPFSVYGDALRKQVIFDMCQKLAARPVELVLRGTGREARDFLHIDDLVAGIIHLANLRQTGLLNLATGISTTIAELAGCIVNKLAPGTRIVFTGEPSKGNPLSLVGSVDMARRLGLHSSVSLETGLSRMCAVTGTAVKGDK